MYCSLQFSDRFLGEGRSRHTHVPIQFSVLTCVLSFRSSEWFEEREKKTSIVVFHFSDPALAETRSLRVPLYMSLEIEFFGGEEPDANI